MNANALSISDLGVTASIKFVYVYDQVNETWRYTLSTSRLFETYTMTNIVYMNGRQYNEPVAYNNNLIAGDYDSAKTDATFAFNSNITKNSCIDKYVISYEGTNKAEIDLHTPNNIAGMFY